MPVKRGLTMEDLPGVRRKSRSLLRKTQEWSSIQAILAQGLKPFEVVEVTLPEEIIRERKNAVRLFAHLTKGHIRDLGLSYDVKIRRRNGQSGVYIVGR